MTIPTNLCSTTTCSWSSNGGFGSSLCKCYHHRRIESLPAEVARAEFPWESLSCKTTILEQFKRWKSWTAINVLRSYFLLFAHTRIIIKRKTAPILASCNCLCQWTFVPVFTGVASDPTVNRNTMKKERPLDILQFLCMNFLFFLFLFFFKVNDYDFFFFFMRKKRIGGDDQSDFFLVSYSYHLSPTRALAVQSKGCGV